MKQRFNQSLYGQSSRKVIWATIVALALFCNLSYSAVPGLPFSEDFSESNLKLENQTSASWVTQFQKVILGQRGAKTLGFGNANATILNISDTSTSSYAIHTADVNGDGRLDAISTNGSYLIVYFNNGTIDPYASPTTSQSSAASTINDIATGDIDQDGDIDIVVSTSATNKLFLNDGTQQPFNSTSAITISSTSYDSTSIQLADMDGDGWLDVVVGNEGGGTPQPDRLYLNQGSSPYLENITGSNISAGNYRTYNIKVADLNNDGFLDVAVSGADSHLKYYLNDKNLDADGNPFTSVTGVTIGSGHNFYIDTLDLGDINNDGWIDIVSSGVGSNTNRAYFNFGDSVTPFDSSSTTHNISTDSESGRDIKIKDLDNDGDLDVMVAYTRSRDRIYLNNGSSDPFSGVSGIEISEDALDSRGIDAADVDGDGDYDILIAHSGINKVYVNNTPTTSFSPADAVDATSETENSQDIDYGDVDNDGDIDVVFADEGFARLLINNGTSQPFAGQSTLLLSLASTAQPRSIKLADVNRDGLLDLLVGGVFGASNGQAVTLIINDGDATPFSGTPANIHDIGPTIGADSYDYTWSFAVGDVNHDGYPDVVMARANQYGSADGINKLFLNDHNIDADGNPFNFIAEIDIGTASISRSVALGDVNGDGNLDLVVGNNSYNLLYLGDGDNSPFSGGSTIITTDADYTLKIILLDVNHDGKLDVITGNTGNTKIYYNDGVGDPFDTATGQTVGTTNLSTSDIAIGDTDRDGNYDIVSVSGSSRRVMLYPITRSSQLDEIEGSYVSSDSVSSPAVAIADFNNDGDQDIFVATSGVNRLYHNSAASEAFNTVRDIAIDTSSYSTVPVNTGDFNRDGHLDVISGVWGGVNKLNLNNGTRNPFNQAAQDIGSDALLTQALAVGDVNNDGWPDIVSGNNGANNLLYLNNGSAPFFTGNGINVSNVAETDETRDLVLSDFNRDGYLDVLVGNRGDPIKIYYHSGNNASPYGVDPYLPLPTYNYNVRAIRAVDVNNDGTTDLVLGTDDQDTTATGTGTGNNTGGTLILLVNGAGSFYAAYFVGSGASATNYDKDNTFGLVFGDVNGDGYKDMITGNYAQANKLYINDGSAQPFKNTLGTDIGTDTDNTRVVLLDDLDQDGDLDLVVTNVNGQDKYYLNDGTAAPFGGAVVGVTLPNSTNPSNPTSYGGVIADIDKDGNNDIIVSDYNGGDHFYRSSPFSLIRNTAVSKAVDAQSDILTATLSVSQTTGYNDSIDYFLSNDGGSYFYQVVPGQEFIFPQPGDDLHWKAVFKSLSPADSSELSQINITARYDLDLDLVPDDVDVCVGTYDPDQTDTDGDAVAGASTGPSNGGDACDSDDDNDGTADSSDAFPLNPSEDTDTDSDCPNYDLTTSGNGCGDNTDTDIDGDGILNAADPFDFNIQPTISGTAATSATPDVLYNFLPVTSDGGDGPALVASLAFEGGTEANLPSWLSFDTSTGRLSGMPSNDDYQTSFGNNDNVIDNIVITVDDSVQTAALAAFNITLADTRAPNSIAVPAGGDYNDTVDVSIFCLENIGSGCQTIRYTTDDAITDPNNFSSVTASSYTLTLDSSLSNVNLRFYSIDATGNAGSVVTENYNFDLDYPAISITAPAAGALLSSLDTITGTATDPDTTTDTGVAAVEIQITDGFDSVLSAGGNLTAGSPVWLPVNTSDGYATWSYPRGSIAWVSDTEYIINARVLDGAGNITTTSTSFTYYSGAPASTSLSLTLTSSAIPNNDSTDATLTFTRLNNTEQDQTGTELLLHITKPDGTPAPDITTTTNFAGQVTLTLGTGEANNISFDTPGQYLLQAEFAGNIQMATVTSSVTSLLVGSSAGYAVIVQGKLPNESGLESHNKTANRIYDTLKDRGFVDQDIFYFNYDDTQLGVDAVPSKAAVQSAIESLNTMIESRPAPVYVILVDHGGEIIEGVSEATFYLSSETITPTELDSWLDTLEGNLSTYDTTNGTSLLTDNKRVVILGSCYSGGFISGLSASDRIVISSASAHEQSYKGPTEDDGIRVGEYFLEELFLELSDGSDLRAAFQQATSQTEAWTRGGDLSANSANGFSDDAVQHPLLDDDADTVGSNAVFSNSSDGQLAKDIVLGFNQDSLTNDAFTPADISRVSDTLYLDSATSSAQLTLYANDPYQVNQAYVEIRTPDKTLSSTGNDTTEQLSNDFIRRAFTPPATSGAPYTLDYTDFAQSGKYEIFYYVNDRFTGALSPAQHSLVYKDRAAGSDPNDPPSAFTLVSPGAISWNGTDTEKTILAFDWGDATDPDLNSSVTYTLLIADDTGFSAFSSVNNADACIAGDVVYKQEELTASSTFVNETAKLCDDHSYYWKVIAVDEYGQHTESTDTFIFHTDDTNAQIGTIVAMVQSNVTAAQLTGANVANQFGESASEIAVVEYNGNYVILTSHVGESQNITATISGYTSSSATGVTVADRETVEVLLSLAPDASQDTDGDGVTDVNDNCPATPNGVAQDNQLNTDGDSQGDACDSDDDNDGLSDSYETTHSLDPLDSADAALDPDGDGVSSLQEAQNGTDPNVEDDIYFADSDGDGVTDNKDNCLSVHNTAQTNTDGDSQGDACDSDDDNDGMPDSFEETYSPTLDPLVDDAAGDADSDGYTNLEEFGLGTSPTVVNASGIDTDSDTVADFQDNCPSIANAGQENQDNDSMGDACDPDIDGDGVANGSDAFPTDASEWSDNDSDGNGDNVDTDDDNDGMPDIYEALYSLDSTDASDASEDADSDGVSNLQEYIQGSNPSIPNNSSSDTDGDGRIDVLDNCPSTANANQADGDNDGIGDVCDTDRDNDGVGNSSDAFPDDNSESIDTDGDGTGNNADTDDDDDGMSDAYETLYGLNPLDATDASSDSDGDGQTNLQEYLASTNPLLDNADTTDTDGDGTVDVMDNCPTDANPTQTDNDSDRLGDACDSDDDNDGLPDSYELSVGLDSNNASDAQSDTDGDGRSNIQEYYDGTDPNISNASSQDTDVDSVADNQDNCPSVANADQTDTDSDGDGDICDDDDDNDGMPDSFELLYQLNPTDASDASGDPDADNITNLDEYLAGSSPKAEESSGGGGIIAPSLLLALLMMIYWIRQIKRVEKKS